MPWKPIQSDVRSAPKESCSTPRTVTRDSLGGVLSLARAVPFTGRTGAAWTLESSRPITRVAAVTRLSI